jgi:hypothetical protein
MSVIGTEEPERNCADHLDHVANRQVCEEDQPPMSR